MAVRIRMKRLGRRHRPFFRICVMDSRKSRDGRAIEEVGSYDPMVKDKAQRVSLKMDRIDYWISVGAQPSDKVATLIKKVKTNKFGTANEPPPLTPPKAPPEPEPEATAGEASAEEAAAPEATSSETTTSETTTSETTTSETSGETAEQAATDEASTDESSEKPDAETES